MLAREAADVGDMLGRVARRKANDDPMPTGKFDQHDLVIGDRVPVRRDRIIGRWRRGG